MKRLIVFAALVLLAAAAGALTAEVTYKAVASGTADVQGVAATTGMRLMGFSITEDAGSPAVARVRLRCGTSTSDPELFDVSLLASESAREWLGADGVGCAAGIFVDRVSGTTRLTLFTVVP